MPTNAADLPNLDLVGNRYQDATDASFLIAGTPGPGAPLLYQRGWANASTSLPRGGQWDDPKDSKDSDVYYLGRLQAGVTYRFWLLAENYSDTVSWSTSYRYEWPGMSFQLGYYDASSGEFRPVGVPDFDRDDPGQRMTFTPGLNADKPAEDEYYLIVYYFNSGSPDDVPYLITTADLSTPETMASYRNAVDNMVLLGYEGGPGNDTIKGNELANTLKGYAGDDTLSGGGGADTLIGGEGNDFLIGGGSDDTIILSGSRWEYNFAYVGFNLSGRLVLSDMVAGRDGTDTIETVEYFQFSDGTISLAQLLNPPKTLETTTNFTLPGGVLNLVAKGGSNVTLTGNAQNNSIIGNTGKNMIDGRAGADKVNGGYGNDTLSGGTGKDAFVFTTKLGTPKTDRKVNFDTIRDFSVKDDSIYLDNAIFKKLGAGTTAKPKQLKKEFFTIGSAKDQDDYIIYNKKTGVLSYDADGLGKGQAVEFAQLKKGLALTHKDFFVI